MKSIVEKDKKIRKSVVYYELKRRVLKSIAYNQHISVRIRWQVMLHLTSIPRDSSKTRLKNRCILTGRGKGVYSSLKISRIVLRDLVCAGNITGFRKSSW